MPRSRINNEINEPGQISDYKNKREELKTALPF
jgi:hypothetical protein